MIADNESIVNSSLLLPRSLKTDAVIVTMKTEDL